MTSSAILLRLPVSKDRKEEKGSSYNTAATSLIWSTNTFVGVFGQRFIHMTCRTVDVGGSRGRHHELEDELDWRVEAAPASILYVLSAILRIVERRSAEQLFERAFRSATYPAGM